MVVYLCGMEYIYWLAQMIDTSGLMLIKWEKRRAVRESACNQRQEREKKITKILNASAIVTVYMHGYRSNCVFMHILTLTDVGVFLVKICKMKSFLHFARLCTHWYGCSYIYIYITEGKGYLRVKHESATFFMPTIGFFLRLHAYLITLPTFFKVYFLIYKVVLQHFTILFFRQKCKTDPLTFTFFHFNPLTFNFVHLVF